MDDDELVQHLIDTPTCVIAFSTQDHNFVFGLPRHEFGVTLRSLGVAYVLVRDNGHWYHQGIAGTDADSYFAQLRRRYARLIAIGVSYGAHGALLYGAKIPADEVIAISPVGDVGRWLRYWNQGDSEYKLPSVNGGTPRVRAFIGTGKDTDLDAQTCEELKIEDVTVFEGVSHSGVARHMRDLGMFRTLIGTY